MAVPNWLAAAENIIAAGHPQFSDTVNRPILDCETLFLVGHDSTGRHLDQNYTLVGEIDTYIGDGSNPRTITLSNSGLDIMMLMVWKDGLQSYETLDLITAASQTYIRKQTNSPIDGFNINTTGQFTISATAAGLNSNGVTFYYCALGIDNTSSYVGDAGAGSDPTWITSSPSNTLLADDTKTSIPNAVQGEIYDAFDHEHDGSTGAHDTGTDPYYQKGRIETGSFEGDGTDNRDILLSNSDLDIKYLVLISFDVVIAQTKSESMAGDTTKREAAAAFVANIIQSIGTGTFQEGATGNVNGFTYYYCAIGV